VVGEQTDGWDGFTGDEQWSSKTFGSKTRDLIYIYILLVYYTYGYTSSRCSALEE
jgi:alkylhydroperoxidase/carboxymuconolactone decarboxylase family protein YurZ